jgi:UDP-2,3-diacylglucosamine hydrolase
MRAPQPFVKATLRRYTRPVLPTPCYVISDAHLGVADRPAELRLVAFLHWARQDARSLVINGDLYDFWFEWKSVIPRSGFRTLGAIAGFPDAGIPTLWIAGNHDCWGGDIIRQDVGAKYVFGPWDGMIGSWKTRIEHGDGLRGVEDRRYRALRVLLRNRAAIWAYRNLMHPDWASRLALGSSAASRTYAAVDKGEGLKRVAESELRNESARDLIIYGHSHVATIASSAAGVYANAGTWLTDTTYLRIDDRAVELYRWKGADAGRGDLLSRADLAVSETRIGEPAPSRSREGS